MENLLEDTLNATQTGASFGRRGRSPADFVQAEAAPALNAVIVTTSPEKMVLVEQLIKSLDLPEAENKVIDKTIHLKNSQAETLSPGRERDHPGPGRGT